MIRFKLVHHRMSGGLFACNKWYEEFQERCPFRWGIKIFNHWFILYTLERGRGSDGEA